MKVWIDGDSGTWGDLESLYIVDIPDETLDTFEEASDRAREYYATMYGARVSALLAHDAVRVGPNMIVVQVEVGEE